ncbi:MAG TPA: tyrosine-type recombinase/integrase [Rubrivivax sp.]|nr:tyrosine-type recombinase/integrase [Rubrivivax sp.]
MGRKGTGVEVRGNAIRIQFSLNGEVVRRTLRRDGTPLPPSEENLSEAKRLAAEIRSRIAAGTFCHSEYFPATSKDGRPLTVGEHLDAWLAVQRIEPSTAAAYASAVRFWKSASCDEKGSLLGDRALHRLKASHVMRALTFRPGLNAKTVNNYATVLRRAMDMAVADHALEDNLVRQVRHQRQQTPFPDPFTRDEVEAIIEYMIERYPDGVANYVEFKFFSGLRPSETTALRWADVDLERDRVHVHRAIVRGLEKNTTKTNTARHVLLNSRARAALLRQRALTQLASDFVFIDPRCGKPWIEERAFRRSCWAPTLKALGLRYRRPYNTRHSYATMMLMSGMTPAFCAAQLGHSVGMLPSTCARRLDGEHNAMETGRLEASLRSDLSLDLSQSRHRSRAVQR